MQVFHGADLQMYRTNELKDRNGLKDERDKRMMELGISVRSSRARATCKAKASVEAASAAGMGGETRDGDATEEDEEEEEDEEQVGRTTCNHDTGDVGRNNTA